MTNVPGVLIVGDYSVHGATPTSSANDGVSSLGVSDINYNRADKPMRVVPDNPATGASTAASLNWYPWFDGGAGDTVYSVASSTSSTVTVTPSPGWTTNQWAPTATRTFFVSVINAFGVGFLDRKVIASNTAATLTISGTWVSNPTTFNGLFISQGRWRDYHAIAGWLTPPEVGSALSTRGGSTWQTLGQGIGYDSGLVRELYEQVWTVAPYFQLAKFADTSPIFSAYDDTHGASRPLFLDHLGRYNTAWTALANGNTLAWELLILDQSLQDVLDWVSNPTHYLSFQTALTQTIAWFRSSGVLNNSSLKVLLVNHANEINNVTAPLGVQLANQVHRAVAAAGTNIRCVSLEGLPLFLPPTYVPNLNKGCYQQSTYWDTIPKLLRQAYQLLAAGNPPAYDGAIPVYIYIGDSIAVGPVDLGYLGSLNSPTITAGPRDTRQRIWNKGNQAVETYDANDNSNTSGTVSAEAGPEVSATVELMNLHPTNGFVLVKRASNGSSLVANAAAYTGGGTSGGRWDKAHGSSEHYNQLLADVQGTFNYINRTMHKQADLKGIFVDLGTNDQIVSGGGDLFAAALAQFVSDLRTDLATRTSGTAVPVVWRVPQLGTSTAIYAESIKVRAACAALALADPQFIAMNVDDLQRLATDNLHETPESAIAHGQRMVQLLAQVAI